MNEKPDVIGLVISLLFQAVIWFTVGFLTKSYFS